MFDKIVGAIRSAAVAAISSDTYVVIGQEAVTFDLAKLKKTSRAAEMKVLLGTAQQVTIGPNPRHEVEGTLQITHYEPDGSGDGSQLSIMSAIADALRSKRISGTGFSVKFYSPTPGDGIREGSHYVRILSAEFKVTFYPKKAS